MIVRTIRVSAALILPIFLSLLVVPYNHRSTIAQSHQFPFQNTALPVEARISNLLSLMTMDEKIACLGTDPSVPRLGIRGSRHVEGIHGLAQGGPANWRPPR